jgi:hypothetical protein
MQPQPQRDVVTKKRRRTKIKTLIKAPGTAHHYYRPSRFLPRVQLWLGTAVLTVFLFTTAIAYHAVYGAPECPATEASEGNSAVAACAAAALAARVQS